jgi:formylmethanofuran dehydrogenase subunit C
VNGLTLTQMTATPQRLDMGGLTPGALAGMGAADVARLLLQVGNRAEPVGELFRVEGSPGPDLTVIPAAANLDNLGAGMTGGRMVVDGDAGALAGSGLAGGSLELRGSAGSRVGAGMTGGSIVVAGDCGDRVGGPLLGHTQGMAGGVIRVSGHVGDRAGERMRRGIVSIGGDAGDFLGAGIIAGTIAVAGRAGEMCALGMRRGTVLLARQPASLPATFNPSGLQSPGFLPLLRPLLESGLLGALTGAREPVQRFVGDLGEDGLGEVLVPGPEAAA